ncbi:MAG: amidase domain-containing protein [Hydrogenoanaerobacterium sp.]
MKYYLREMPYDREKAIQYAHTWAYFRNPAYYNFEEIGGDCTNYASQCLYAGAGVMNYTKTFGWYYINLDERAPAWSGVPYLYNFLTANTGAGPYGHEVDISQAVAGDLAQLVMSGKEFGHTPFIIAVNSPAPTLDNVLVSAHTADSDCRPLSSYAFSQLRFIHIDGVRFIEAVED